MSPDEQRQFYEQLVHEHGEELFRIAYRLTGRREVAEDLVQETFTEAWRSLPELRRPESARAWLFRILRFRHAHLLRASGRMPQVDGSIGQLGGVEPAIEVASFEGDVLSEPVQAALDAMDSRFTVVFLMVMLLGMSCREAAEELGIPLGTVLSRVHRARQFLRRRLAPAVAGGANVLAFRGRKA